MTRRTGEIYRWFARWRETLSCQNCGEDHPSTIEFHHRDPKEKLGTVPSMVWDAKDWSDVERVRDEIKKCDVLCSNCHKKEHYKYPVYPKLNGRTPKQVVINPHLAEIFVATR